MQAALVKQLNLPGWKTAFVQPNMVQGDLVDEFRYLQDQVSRQKTIGTLGRTVVLQTLHKDPRQVPTTDLDPELPLDPLQPHHPGLHPPQACARNPATRTQLYRSLQTFLHLDATAALHQNFSGEAAWQRRPPEGSLRAGGGRGLLGRRRHGALVLLAQRVDGRVEVGRAVLLAAERLHARA